MGVEDKYERALTNLVEERRSYPRFVVDEEASVLVVGHGMTFLARILELGLDGCRLRALANLPGGGRVRIEVTFSVNGLPFRMGGAIRWSDGQNMGIQFVRVSPSRHEEWSRVIEELKVAAAKELEEAVEAAARTDYLSPRDAGLIQIVDANLADAASRAGLWLACRIGCTQCCHGAFAINALDAARLRAGMSSLRAKSPAIARAVEERAHEWIAEYGEDFPGDATTGLLGTSEDDLASFEEFADEAPCPVLDPATGRCDLYAWRPMTCRVFGPPVRAAGANGEEGIGHCELCFVGASAEQIAKCEMRVPHDLEQELLEDVGEEGETLVAFALLK